MTIDVLIAGLDAFSSREVERAVRRTMNELVATSSPDGWEVAVLPSDRRDRWDVGLRGPRGWSLTWFDAEVKDLPVRAANGVRQMLQR